MTFPIAARNAGLMPRTREKAIKKQHRQCISVGKDIELSGSVDLDNHFSALEPSDARWDCGIGLDRPCHVGNIGRFVIWVEAHSASASREVTSVINKLKWLKEKLRTTEFRELNALTDAARANGHVPYRWVYTGNTIFRAHGMARPRLSPPCLNLPVFIIHIE